MTCDNLNIRKQEKGSVHEKNQSNNKATFSKKTNLTTPHN